MDELGSYTVAKDTGKIRSEGRDYLVEDGDVMNFRFNIYLMKISTESIGCKEH